MNQARSSISKFFKEGAFASVLKLRDAGKYAYGYEVLALLDKRRKQKPKMKGDRYHTKSFGQALRYGQYAVVAVCANLGPANNRAEAQALDAVLMQWMGFESWAEGLQSNSSYKSGASFDYVNDYKGSTINADLQHFAFAL